MSLSVNGEVIDDNLLLEEVAHYRNNVLSTDDRKTLPYEAILGRVKERLIHKTLLFQEARKRNSFSSVVVDEHYKRAVEQHGNEQDLYNSLGLVPKGDGKNEVRDYLRLNMEVEAILDELCKDIDPPNDADLKMFFEDNQRFYWEPESYSGVRIERKWTTTEEKEVLLLLEEKRQGLHRNQDEARSFLKGEGFSKWSEPDLSFRKATKEQLLSLGTFDSIETFATSSLQTNKDRTGFYLITEVHPKRIPSFGEVKEQVHNDLMNELKTMKINIHLSRLKQRALIVDHDLSDGLSSFST